MSAPGSAPQRSMIELGLVGLHVYDCWDREHGDCVDIVKAVLAGADVFRMQAELAEARTHAEENHKDALHWQAKAYRYGERIQAAYALCREEDDWTKPEDPTDRCQRLLWPRDVRKALRGDL